MGTLELIKALPAELREKICKEFVRIKQGERAALGWGEVNKVIKKAPVSNEQIEMKPFCLRAYCANGREGIMCKNCENSHGIIARLHVQNRENEIEAYDEYISFVELYERERQDNQEFDLHLRRLAEIRMIITEELP